MQNRDIKKITYAGLMMALVFVATAFLPRIPIPFAQQSYIHVGDSMIFITAILFGWKYGAVVGGIGSSLADIVVGSSIWAIPTLITKAVMGAIVGFMAGETKDKKGKYAKNIFSLCIGGSWIVLGVYFHQLLGNVSDSAFTAFLVKELKLKGPDELHRLAGTVRNVLLSAVILIPIIIMVLFIFLNKKDKTLFSINSLMGTTLGGLCMVIGYYIAEILIVGNIIVPIFSIPLNLVQFIGSAVIAFIILIPLKNRTGDGSLF